MRLSKRAQATAAVGALVAVSIACGTGAAQAQDTPAPVANSGSASGSTTMTNGLFSGLVPPILLKALAFAVVPPDQMSSFEQLISHESSWDMFARNPSSGAYGLPQALPAEKMGDEGPFWLFDPLTQLRWAYKYMNERYGSPNEAWAFWQANHWY